MIFFVAVVAGALLFLGAGVWLRSRVATASALAALVIVALLAIPRFVSAVSQRDDAAVAAIVGLDSAAAIALATLLLWRISRRYPVFSATAVFFVGIGAVLLMLRVVVAP